VWRMCACYQCALRLSMCIVNVSMRIDHCPLSLRMCIEHAHAHNHKRKCRGAGTNVQVQVQVRCMHRRSGRDSYLEELHGREERGGAYAQPPRDTRRSVEVPRGEWGAGGDEHISSNELLPRRCGCTVWTTLSTEDVYARPSPMSYPSGTQPAGQLSGVGMAEKRRCRRSSPIRRGLGLHPGVHSGAFLLGVGFTSSTTVGVTSGSTTAGFTSGSTTVGFTSGSKTVGFTSS